MNLLAHKAEVLGMPRADAPNCSIEINRARPRVTDLEGIIFCPRVSSSPSRVRCRQEDGGWKTQRGKFRARASSVDAMQTISDTSEPPLSFSLYSLAGRPERFLLRAAIITPSAGVMFGNQVYFNAYPRQVEEAWLIHICMCIDV